MDASNENQYIFLLYFLAGTNMVQELFDQHPSEITDPLFGKYTLQLQRVNILHHYQYTVCTDRNSCYLGNRYTLQLQRVHILHHYLCTVRTDRNNSYLRYIPVHIGRQIPSWGWVAKSLCFGAQTSLVSFILDKTGKTLAY